MTDLDDEQIASEVPIWPAMIDAVLGVLATTGPMHRKELFDRSASAANLSEVARAERLATGGLRYEQRMGWVLSNTMRAGWVARPSRAIYEITPEGLAWLKSDHETFTYGDAREVFRPYWPAAHSRAVSEQVNLEIVEALESVDPVEQIENAVQRIQEDVAEQLLTRLRDSHPSFFESAVVEVLLSMGYGGADRRGRAIGGTGDGGVDGVIDQDALGLDRIYVQAKRYKEGSNVGRESIQAFVGALDGVNASKGVFITTSKFTADARSYVTAIKSRVILIDGDRLTNLMIEYGVGVQTKETYSVVEVDEDFFE